MLWSRMGGSYIIHSALLRRLALICMLSLMNGSVRLLLVDVISGLVFKDCLLRGWLHVHSLLLVYWLIR